MRLILWGGTGQSKVLRECMDYHGDEVIAVFDNSDHIKPPFGDVPLYHGNKFEEWLQKQEGGEEMGFLVAIGGDRGKERVAMQEYLGSFGLIPLTAVHPRAWIGKGTVIGAGAQILANAVVSVDAELGVGCIMNTGSTVDHECRLGDGVHIAPGAHLAGSVDVGSYATVYTGAVVLPRIRIGEGAVVGAGAVVRRDVPPYAVVIGNPGRILRVTPHNDKIDSANHGNST